MTHGEFVESVAAAMGRGELKPIWMRAVLQPKMRELIEAALKAAPNPIA